MISRRFDKYGGPFACTLLTAESDKTVSRWSLVLYHLFAEPLTRVRHAAP